MARMLLLTLAALVALASLGAIAPMQPADDDEKPVRPEDLPEVVVELVGENRISGLLVEQTADHVILRIAGAQKSLPAEKVTHITVLAPVLDRYEAMRSEIAEDDVASILQLALWLEQRERYDLAVKEIDRALEIEPLDWRAIEARRRIIARKELAEKIRRNPGRRVDEPEATGTRSDEPALPRLTPEQINLIRVFEIDLADPPEIVIEDETIDKLIERFDGDIRFPASPEEQKALYDEDPLDILRMIFELRARDLYDDVHVKEDPAAMALFRERVHRPLIINSCATSGCHSDPGAGRLRLIRDKRFSDATVYTNFLILERFKLDDGTPLIDYEEPATSPLLQMGLDRDLSSTPHPVVPGPSGRGDRWRPTMRSIDDRRFDDTIRWIRSMYRPRPEYPIDYELPAAEPGPATAGPPR